MDAATPIDARPRAIERVRERVSAADLAAVAAFAVALIVYVRTLLGEPGKEGRQVERISAGQYL